MSTAASNDQVWQEFQHALAECLGDLDHWDSLIISDWYSGLFVQFSGDGRGTPMRAEASSKVSPREGPPTGDECLAMRKLGWFGVEDHRTAFKRKSFEHEQAVRAVITFSGVPKGASGIDPTADNPLSGQCVSVDLAELIEQVYIAPEAPPWFCDLVDQVSKRYGYH